MSDEAGRLYERVLILRCQAGDEAGFEELLGRYGARVGYYVGKMLGGVPGREDVLQDVWLDVFRHLPRLADPAAFPAWLYRIARDRVYRELRKRRRAPRPLVDEPPAEEADDGTDFTAEDAARVHAALDTLAAEHREVLVLRFLEGMSYDDIGRVLGCPLGTVRSRLYYGKRALRRVLEKESYHE